MIRRPPARSTRRPAQRESTPLSSSDAEKAPKISAVDQPVVLAMSCESAPSA